MTTQLQFIVIIIIIIIIMLLLNIFPHFFCPPCPLESWFQMQFYVSIFLILCRNFVHLVLSLEYRVRDVL